MSQTTPSPGNVVGRRYRLERMLVQGGMGSVWKAHHISLNAPVAIKFISPLVAEDGEAIGRFMLEAQSAAALRSSHIVQVFDFGLDDGVPFIAMELLQGESLAERLRRRGALSAHETGRILSQVARGIHYAHALGIVHRDLKPDNIFITTEADQEVVKVLDFGVAKATGRELHGQSSATTRAGTLVGSPYYVSPEQAEGERDIDHRSDLWALGIIAFECLTGRRPFESESLAGLLVKICTQPSPRPSTFGVTLAGFDGWFLRTTEKRREGRFQSVRDMIDAYAKLFDATGAGPSDIVWSSSANIVSPVVAMQGELSDTHARTALSSTPHPAPCNQHVHGLSRTQAEHRELTRNVAALLGVSLLLALAFVVGNSVQFRSIGAHATLGSLSMGPKGAKAAVGDSNQQPSASTRPAPADCASVPKPMPPEVTLVASGIEPGANRSTPAGRAQPRLTAPEAGPNREPARQGSITPTAPSSTSGHDAGVNSGRSGSATEDLFRSRKVPGEAAN
jgi:eukaryotic-like serine/threonine-protein kinase